LKHPAFLNSLFSSPCLGIALPSPVYLAYSFMQYCAFVIPWGRLTPWQAMA